MDSYSWPPNRLSSSQPRQTTTFQCNLQDADRHGQTGNARRTSPDVLELSLDNWYFAGRCPCKTAQAGLGKVPSSPAACMPDVRITIRRQAEAHQQLVRSRYEGWQLSYSGTERWTASCNEPFWKNCGKLAHQIHPRLYVLLHAYMTTYTYAHNGRWLRIVGRHPRPGRLSSSPVSPSMVTTIASTISRLWRRET